ncbi:MAG: hypothetical protein QY317_10065 [Candidatus Jettenia caeni]|nr:MAG: hypothetical protein JETT_2057 [Candidatus Jettenia ecosi]WKZ14250.1 MAG: hypothetical protein QY317_10065 [Candidatus Jettenia caeni]
MEFTYYGECYRCKERSSITSVPLGGIRICQECLLKIGELFLEVVGSSKIRNDWENLSMDEIIPKILNICFNSGLGTYLMFKELNEPCESKQEIPDKI